MYKLIASKEDKRVYIYVYENDNLVEHYSEDINKRREEGNIYLARVKNIVEGMQGVFLDIGNKEEVLLHINDLASKKDNVTGNLNVDFSKFDIKKYVKVNDNIIVQIKKDSDTHKGAKATTDIKLTGRFVILLPNSKYVTVSSKITDEKVVKKLKQLVKDEECGIIFRTASQDASKQEILNEITLLKKAWENILSTLDTPTNVDDIINVYGNGLKPKLLFDSMGMVRETNIRLTPKRNRNICNK